MLRTKGLSNAQRSKAHRVLARDNQIWEIEKQESGVYSIELAHPDALFPTSFLSFEFEDALKQVQDHIKTRNLWQQMELANLDTMKLTSGLS